MLRVPIAHAQPGMILSQPVFHPIRHGTVLLNDGLRLDRWSIDRLSELKIREVWIRYPGMEGVLEYVCPEIAAAQAALAAHAGEAFDLAIRDAHSRMDFALYRRGIASLIERFVRKPGAALFLQEMVHRDRESVRHAAGVCYLSTLMGLKLQDYLIVERSRLDATVARDVSSLGLAGMFHDVGMLRLADGAAERWLRERDETDPMWRAHVQIGSEMVREAAGPAAAAAILHHHQRFDGSGFPARRHLDGRRTPVVGRDIHVFSRIVAAADIFDRLRHPLAGTGRGESVVPVVRALARMRAEPVAGWIDPMVFKALLACVPPYPPGSLVRLTTDVQAAVVDWDPREPCRPIVEVIVDLAREHALDESRRERIDLRDHPEMEVAQAEGQDVLDANFYASTPGELDLAEAERSLFNAAPREGVRAGAD